MENEIYHIFIAILDHIRIVGHQAGYRSHWIAYITFYSAKQGRQI